MIHIPSPKLFEEMPSSPTSSDSLEELNRSPVWWIACCLWCKIERLCSTCKRPRVLSRANTTMLKWDQPFSGPDPHCEREKRVSSQNPTGISMSYRVRPKKRLTSPWVVCLHCWSKRYVLRSWRKEQEILCLHFMPGVFLVPKRFLDWQLFINNNFF